MTKEAVKLWALFLYAALGFLLLQTVYDVWGINLAWSPIPFVPQFMAGAWYAVPFVYFLMWVDARE